MLVLGSETASPGSRIVFEAKGKKSHTPNKIREELQTARENRQAQVGVFVWSKNSAPADEERLSRWGSDILVIWDSEDPTSDVFLKAAISLVRLMVVQEKTSSEDTATDIKVMDEAISAITPRPGRTRRDRNVGEYREEQWREDRHQGLVDEKKIDDQLETLSHHVRGLRDLSSI